MSANRVPSAESAVYLWTYAESSRNFAGWHLTADEAACRALLEAIDQLADSDSLTTATQPPTAAILAIPNNRRAAVRAGSRLTVRAESERGAWRLAESAGEVTIVVGPDRLEALRRGIHDVRRGRGDYSLGADYKRASRDQRLWFWWMPRVRGR